MAPAAKPRALLAAALALLLPALLPGPHAPARGARADALPNCTAPLGASGGDHMPYPAGGYGTKAPGVVQNNTFVDPGVRFEAGWFPPARAPWLGIYKATGHVPDNTFATTPGSPITYNFTGLAAGHLPKGTFFIFGDLDFGSGPESFIFKAFNASGAPITTPWLGAPVAVYGAKRNGSAPAQEDLPGWSFDAANGNYTFIGNTVPDNPTVGVALPTLEDIYGLEFYKTATNDGFTLSAPDENGPAPCADAPPPPPPPPPACTNDTVTALAGGGANLPLPINPDHVKQLVAAPPNISDVTASGWVGSWYPPVQAGWLGSFRATGPVTDNQHSGSTDYNFSALAAGLLPAGTFFEFGDVDGGSGSGEVFLMTAYDSSGAALTSPWLTAVQYVWGTGRNGPLGTNPPSQLDMPSWLFMPSTGQYKIDGSGVTGFNPSIGFALQSLVGIARLSVFKGSDFNGFSLYAVNEGDPRSIVTPCNNVTLLVNHTNTTSGGGGGGGGPTGPSCNSVTITGVPEYPKTIWPAFKPLFRSFTVGGGTPGSAPISSVSVQSIVQDDRLSVCCKADATIQGNKGTLRDHKSPGAKGRAYRINVVVTDTNGLSCTAEKIVVVASPSTPASKYTPFSGASVFNSTAKSTGSVCSASARFKCLASG